MVLIISWFDSILTSKLILKKKSNQIYKVEFLKNRQKIPSFSNFRKFFSLSWFVRSSSLRYNCSSFANFAFKTSASSIWDICGTSCKGWSMESESPSESGTSKKASSGRLREKSSDLRLFELWRLQIMDSLAFA